MSSSQSSEISMLEPCLERHFTGHKESITSVRFSPRGDLLATSSEDSTVIVWNLKQAARCIRFNAHDAAVRDIAWHPCTNLVASASNDRTVKLWQPLVSGISSDFLAHSKTVSTLDFNRNGSHLVTGSHDKTVKVWSIPSRKFVSAFTAHTNYINAVRFSPLNVDQVASCSDDRSVRVFDVRTGECTRAFSNERLNSHNSTPLCLAWHPTGALLAVGFSCGRIRIFDVAASELIQLYHVHADAVHDVSFHNSGNYMLTGSADGTMKMLDLLEGRPIFTLTGHTGPVKTATFSHDGARFASAGHDKQLLVWKSNLVNCVARPAVAQESNASPTEAPKVIDPRQSAEYTSVDENLQIELSDIEFSSSDTVGNCTEHEITSSATDISINSDEMTINATREFLVDVDYILQDIMREVKNLHLDVRRLTCRVDILEGNATNT